MVCAKSFVLEVLPRPRLSGLPSFAIAFGSRTEIEPTGFGANALFACFSLEMCVHRWSECSFKHGRHFSRDSYFENTILNAFGTQ